MKILRRTVFGNPVLCQSARQLSQQEVLDDATQTLIANMRYTLEKRHYGVGRAAPQVGQTIAVSLVGIKPTLTRPDNPSVHFVIITLLLSRRTVPHSKSGKAASVSALVLTSHMRKYRGTKKFGFAFSRSLLLNMKPTTRASWPMSCNTKSII
jgi:hypothetical protein